MHTVRSDHWLTTQRAAQLLGCTVQHLRLLIRAGKVDGHRFGRDWMADRQSVEDYGSRRYAERKDSNAAVAREQRALFDDPQLHPVVNVSSVPQRSPFRYPGGKTWLVPIARMWLASLSHKPKTLVEPFAGGGGIGLMAAFEKHVDKSLLVELDTDVASVWKCMIGSEVGQLVARILSFKCEESNVRAALAEPAIDTAGRAFQTILRNRVSRGGILAPGAGLVKSGEAGKGIASRWYPETLARRIEEIHAHRERLAFREEDGMDTICEFAKDPEAAFFVDPPYPIAGRRLYRLFCLDHRELFVRLEAVKGPFLATYDQNPDIQNLAEEFGFSWKLVPMKSTHHTRKFELVISRDVSFLSSTS